MVRSDFQPNMKLYTNNAGKVGVRIHSPVDLASEQPYVARIYSEHRHSGDAAFMEARLSKRQSSPIVNITFNCPCQIVLWQRRRNAKI
jgi:hypothetical protein